MRCKICDYRLWNLSVRNCPECGESFKPSDYTFVPNSVRYLCPECGQDYYGNTPTGHLQPTEFDCVKCSQRLYMDEMVLLPTAGLDETATEPDRNPWLNRANVGRIKAWFQMLGRGLIMPGRLLRVTPGSSSTGQAWWYLTVNVFVFSLISMLLFGVGCGAMFLGISGLTGGGGGGPPPGQIFLTMMGMMGMFLGGTILAVFLGVLIWGGIAHFILSLGSDKPSHGIGRTYQALCYTSGTTAFLSAPNCIWSVFAPITGIWWSVTATLALKDAHQVSGGKAALAGLAWPGIVTVGVAVLFIGMIFYTNSMTIPGPAAGMTMPTTGNAWAAAKQVAAFADNSTGKPPDHALELLIDSNALLPGNFVGAPNTKSSLQTVPVGDQTLADFDALDADGKRDALAPVIQALPKDVKAHRVGDLVFVYHGMNFAFIDEDLWTVIEWPDPDVNADPTIGTMLEIGFMDGSVRSIPVEDFDEHLEEQNMWRDLVDLPPLPHPSDVTHDQPAVEEDDGH